MRKRRLIFFFSNMKHMGAEKKQIWTNSVSPVENKRRVDAVRRLKITKPSEL